MMGRSHALSGAVGWLTGCALLDACGATVTGPVVWSGAAVSAGMALLPDLDHPNSTVSRTLGPITRLLSAGTVQAAQLVQKITCRHCAAISEAGGHRGLTHTAVGAILSGAAAAVVVWLGGRTAGMVAAGFAVWLALHAALSSKVRARIGDVVLPGRFRRIGPRSFRFAAAVGSVLAALLVAAGIGESVAQWSWLGPAVGWGCLAHSLGDALTYSRVPLLWPLQIGGCRWARVGAPRWLRFRTGSMAEKCVVVLMVAAGVGAVAMLGSTQ